MIIDIGGNPDLLFTCHKTQVYILNKCNMLSNSDSNTNYSSNINN